MNQLASPRMVTTSAILLGIYCAVVLALVIRGALKTKSIDDYAVGSLAFSPVVVGLSLAASMMSAATFIINPGLIARFGISGVISYALVMPIGALVSFVVLTKGFRKHGTAVKANTMAQWIGQRFGSRAYAIFFALLALLLITFIVLICVGLTKVISKSLMVSELTVLIGVVLFIFGYMMFGGANSMVYTNAVQACLMLIVGVMLLGSGAEHVSDGLSTFFSKLAAIDPNLAKATNAQSPLFRDWFEIGFCQVLIGVAVVCQPHIITKSLLLKSDRDVGRYLWVSVLVSGAFFLVVIVGLFARLTFPDLQYNGAALETDGIVSAYVVHRFSPYAAVIVVMGLIAAGISTLEGLIQSLSTSITSDLIRPLRRRLSGGKADAEQLAQRDRDQPSCDRRSWELVSGLPLTWRAAGSPRRLSVAIFAQNGVYAYFAAAFVPVLLGTFVDRRAQARAVNQRLGGGDRGSLRDLLRKAFALYGGQSRQPGRRRGHRNLRRARRWRWIARSFPEDCARLARVAFTRVDLRSSGYVSRLRSISSMLSSFCKTAGSLVSNSTPKLIQRLLTTRPASRRGFSSPLRMATSTWVPTGIVGPLLRQIPPDERSLTA
jgi:sodium/pantothenate symporter